jgi:hypothetical protein
MGTIHLAVTLKLEERLVFIRRLHFFPEHVEQLRQWESGICASGQGAIARLDGQH